jgi:hypothetical protein
MGIAFAVLGLAAVVFVLGGFVRGTGRLDARSSEGRRADARRMKIAALVLLGLGIAFYLAFAVGEMAGGDISGIQHLLPAAVLGVLLWLGWKRPRTAGIVLLALAIPLGAAYIAVLVVRHLALPWALWIALPPALTGWPLLRAGRGEHRPR